MMNAKSMSRFKAAIYSDETDHRENNVSTREGGMKNDNER